MATETPAAKPESIRGKLLALVARRYGIGTQSITLYPIGGVARLNRMPREPSQELWIALAGPAVNALIALGLGMGMFVAGGLEGLLGQVLGGSFVGMLFTVNLVLLAFNLLPAFPMDGGRVLRALLATIQPYSRATEWAGRVGQGMALVFALAAPLTGNFMLLFLALFVFLAAQAEINAARTPVATPNALAAEIVWLGETQHHPPRNVVYYVRTETL